MALGILALVMTIMRAMPESISYGNLRKAFPIQKNKPMINDLECWDALAQAAKIMIPEHRQLILNLQENFPGAPSTKKTSFRGCLKSYPTYV
ncbi:MAG: hypothetical protein RM022_013060 [Nostoc sp. EfeVER01]|uniref:hypothetical protein n=1 Tax=unclassified Nostoc TaxID=2593658 RepID=UPI002AD37CBE|nr:hypothetical protein [Nostoc sp. EspVER01]MDZ7996070.1 hypothetical protein [Nostoc sp. EspVER01]